MAQPTWVLMQTAQCSRSSRSSTHSIRSPSASSRSSFSVPSSALAVGGDPRGPDSELAGQLLADRLGQVGHLLEGGGALSKSHRRTWPAAIGAHAPHEPRLQLRP